MSGVAMTRPDCPASGPRSPGFFLPHPTRPRPCADVPSPSMPTSTHPTGPAAHEPALRAAQMHLCKPAEPALATVTRSELCTASKKAAGFVRHIELSVAGTPLAGACTPGQSVGVLPPGTDEHGKPHKLRLYSLASPTAGEDGHGQTIATTVKRSIDEHWTTHRLFAGVCSNYLCDLKPGDTVKLTGPSGKKFVLPENPSEHDYVFFATGTGIAPFRGMALDLLRGGPAVAAPGSKIALVMGSPYSTDLLYHDLFTELARTSPDLAYLPAISREPNGLHGRMYVQDRLVTDRDRLEALLKSPRTLVYICGIAGMELGIFQRLARVLAGSDLEQYLAVDRAAMENIDGWERSMIHRQVAPTRRVLLEVYA
ncbi:MAG: hypothetical protein C0475_07160 [Planctomyces sp.]|nr:hypothetical protein [Planctomyces sp.]